MRGPFLGCATQYDKRGLVFPPLGQLVFIAQVREASGIALVGT